MTKKLMRPPTIAELRTRGKFASIEGIVAESFRSIVPSERLTVTESAIKYTRVSAGGSNSRPWDLSITPYLQEPQDMLTSLDYQGMIFVGPARTGKSVMALNMLGHTVINDPTDMLYVQMNRENARKWSKSDLDRFLKMSPEVRKRQLVHRKDDNTFDKEFTSGMRLLVTYPTVENLSSITVRSVFFMDYDRMGDDVDGEGTPYDLGRKRTTTFKRFGMTAAESSPNPDKELLDPKWIAETPHQAPPVRGIFELYNRGDRRRYYWQCPECTEAFEPDFKLLRYPATGDMLERAEKVYMACPHCGGVIPPSAKQELNSAGRWVRDGMIWMPDGEIVNRPGYTPARSDIASFWLKGPAAGYQDWKSLVLEYIRAEKAYADTGDEGPLRKTVTTDQALYYISKARLSERKPEDLKDKAEFWGSVPERATVPEGVRFLIATVDVQAKSFVVQVHGFMPTGDIVVVDSFRLTVSNRINENGERLMMEPPIYSEDWDLLETEILHRSYELADESGRRMRIRVTACDSGGREGTTAQAYDFWRRLRAKPEALHRRFILVKGDGQQRGVSKRPRAATTWPDSAQKDKFTASRGDVPVVMLNSNLLKDQLAGMLARRVGHTVFENTEGTEVAEGRVGLGMIRYPNWMPDWFFKQMTNEVRTEKGWENPASRRNEVWDLLYYAIGVAIRPNEKGVPLVNINFDRLNFEDPPAWAAEWDHNDMVFGRTSEKAEVGKASNPLDRLGKLLG